MADAQPITPEPEPWTPEIAPGLFTERTLRGDLNRWVSGNNVRFRDGLPQTVGGYSIYTLSGATVSGKVRAIHEWISVDGEKWIAFGSSAKLYVANQGVAYDITPLRETASLTDPFTTTMSDATVLVTDVNHNAETGDYITVIGASAVGGITPNGSYQITVVDSDTYTIEHSSPASSGATGGGAVTIQYDISSGGDDPGYWYGWGTCGWGVSTWGTPRGICSTMLRPLRIWSLDNWGEDLMASPSQGAVYYWDRTLGPTSRAVVVPTAPHTNQRILVSPDSRQLICLGATDSEGNIDPKNIRVSNNEDFTDFEIDLEDTSSNAYEERLDAGSKIIAGVRTRAGTFISTDLSVHILQPDIDLVYKPTNLGEGNPFAGPNAGVDVDGTIYYMSNRGFYTFDGVLGELPCEVWSKVFGAQTGEGVNLDYADKIFCSYNDAFQEVWWDYPAAGSTENDRYVAYSVREKTWFFGSRVRTAFAESGATIGKKFPYGFDSSGVMYKHENGKSIPSSLPVPWSLESYDITMPGDQPGHISCITPDDKYRTGSIRITIRTKKFPKSTAATKGPYELTTSTTEKSVRARGRYVSFLIEGGYSGTEAEARLGHYTFEVQSDGGSR
jgi:hypothetical protein